MDPTTKVLDTKTKLDVARKMYLIGFWLLPWLWMVNYIMFKKDLLKASTPPQLKKCKHFSNLTC